ncbi:MAG: glycosyltransferase family 4 protein [Candidatus Kryptonium sp.]
MKILILSHKMPYPPKDGGSIVTLNYAKELANLGCEVTILAMNTYKRKFEVDKIPEELKKLIKFYAVDVDTKIRLVYLFINIFQDVSYHIWRYGASSKYKNTLLEILNSDKFDIVQLEGLYLAPYLGLIKNKTNAKIILRSHNIEYEILERYADWESSILKKYWLKVQSERLRKYEFKVLNQFDAVIAITERDARVFKENNCKVPIFVAPAGIEIDNYKVQPTLIEPNSLFFIGALDWFPNQQGLEWFLKNVWMELHEKLPELKFYIAGRNPNLWRFSSKISKFPNVELIGEVEDAIEFMRNKEIMVVPVFAGSGIRVKIIEALAMGKIVITTSIGIEGIEYGNSKNILIANTKDEFVQSILNCPKIFDSLQGDFMDLSKYDIKILANFLLEFYKKVTKQAQN